MYKTMKIEIDLLESNDHGWSIPPSAENHKDFLAPSNLKKKIIVTVIIKYAKISCITSHY